MRTIKKYPNRRLYDTEVSRYITISDLRQLIIEGEEFEVVDVASGDDLTRAVLLQIINEQESGGDPLLRRQYAEDVHRLPKPQPGALCRPAAGISGSPD
jgi:polyhydroxyalkanoate synthesis repressor PhaR